MIATVRLEATDQDLLRISEENPGWQVERDESGAVIMSPTSTAGGAKSLEAARQLANWARAVASARVFDSSTGFKLPSSAVLSPDAAWISPETIAALGPERRQTFWLVTPDVVIELRSETDPWSRVQARIENWRRDGSSYAVGIDPYRRDVFERGTRPETLHLDFEAIFDA